MSYDDFGLFNPPALRDLDSEREATREELRGAIGRDASTEEILPILETLDDLEKESGMSPGEQSQAIYDLRQRDIPRVLEVESVKMGTGRHAVRYHRVLVETEEIEGNVFVNARGDIIPAYAFDFPAFKFKDRKLAERVAELARHYVRRADR